MSERPFPWRPGRIAARSVSFGALYGLLLGTPFGCFAWMIGGGGVVALVIFGGTAVAFAVIGAVAGLLTGAALITFGAAVRQSRSAAALITGAGIALTPLAVTLWLLTRPPSGAHWIAVAITVISFATGAAAGPRLVAGRGDWPGRDLGAPPGETPDVGGGE